MTAPALKEPIRYGKYTLFERLGQGGMAEVFLARQDGAGGFAKKVVIKRILGDFATDATFVEMFLAEAKLAAHLSHPNIVQIFDMGQEGDTYYIAMEYVSGPNLLQLLRYATMARDPRPAAFVKVASGIAEGLYYAHNAVGPDGQPLKIVHRDINPPNIIVSTEGIPKICDFGVAKSANKESTTGATLKGKYTYMAPEQVKGERVDHRADIFSMGVVLFETTTNKRLFKRDTELQVLNAVLSDPIPRPSQILPAYPPKLEEIVMWCLERDRDKRCPDARALHMALEDYLRASPDGMSQLQLGDWIRGVLPTEVRDNISGQSGFYSVSGQVPSGKDSRTPTGWTPSHLGKPGIDVDLQSNSKSKPGIKPITASGRPPAGTGGSQRPVILGDASADEPQQQTIVHNDEGQQIQGISVPTSGGFPWKWVGAGAGALGLAAVVGVAVSQLGQKPVEPIVAVTPKVEPKIDPKAAEPQMGNEEAAKYYTDEAKRLLAAGRFGPAASLVAKSKALNPQSPATNVAIAELEEEAEVGARLAAARQALSDGDMDRVVNLAKLVLDKQPTQEEALALLKQAKAKKEPAAAVRTTQNGNASARPGILSVEAPAGSRVYVDDEPMGQAPIARLTLAVGKHHVEVRRDGFRPEVHDVVLTSGKTETVSAKVDAHEEVRVALVDPAVKADVGKPAPRLDSVRDVVPPNGKVADPSLARPIAGVVAPVPTAAGTTGTAAVAPTPTPDPVPVPVPKPPEGELYSDGMTRPQRLSGDDPKYTSAALMAHVSGTFMAKCDVSVEGRVHDCKVIKHVEMMDDAVLEAFQSWKMKPAEKDGKPVAVRSYLFSMKLVAPDK